MNYEIVKDVLLWCGVINYGILLWWFLFFVFAHDWIYQLHSKWFSLSVEQFDHIHYVSMAVFKLSLFMFNLVPYIALQIVL